MTKFGIVNAEEDNRNRSLDELTEEGRFVAALPSGLYLRESLESLLPDVMVLDIMLRRGWCD
ncbi:MAG: hypothetical protein HQK57_12910 [Deltaproteobacteria bacterium]|nr:hypothetical protein [Deltaproteobacteria bacterium]